VSILSTQEPAIEAASVTVSYGDLAAVVDAHLSVSPGELMALLGPSGSGKTTLLRAIAGFERPDAGTIRVAGREVLGPRTWVEPEQRRVGMVFQHGALFPHLTALANVAFGAADGRRAEHLLDLVGLSGRAGAYPHELSGGERQRVALARALGPEPAVVLLDEPFASLDPSLRDSLRGEVVRILREAAATALLVTHDQAEALSVADRVAVMRDGRIEQLGPADEVYLRPNSRWVAEFVGEANILPGTAADGLVECELGRLAALPSVDGEVEIVLRPENVALEPAGNGNGAVEAVVLEQRQYGHDHLTVVRLPSGRIVRSRRLGFATWPQGARVRIAVESPVGVLPLAQRDGVAR
jgi:iron(III) transport system ATP-binding protein